MIDISELIWTLAALVGLGFSLKNVFEAATDFLFVKRYLIGNGRRIIARVHLRTAIARAILMLVFLTFGAGNLVDCFDRTDQPWIVGTWIVTTLMFMYCAVMDSRDYNTLLKTHKTK